MDDWNQVYESDEGEGEFYGFGGGQLGGLGEADEMELVNNQGNPEDEYQENEVPVRDESEEGSASGEEAEAQEVGDNQQKVILIQALPPIPSFEPYKHPRPPHKWILNLPQEFFRQDNMVHDLGSDHRTPRSLSDFFMLFFDKGQFANLAVNTNTYAMVKGAGRNSSRKWYAAQVGEMMIFVGLIIYIGLYH